MTGMLRRSMRVSLAAGACVLLQACGPAPTSSRDSAPRVPYLEDASFRRAELVVSLVNPTNGYSQLRLTHYASGDGGDWERLPEWNPPVEAIAATELDASGGASSTSLSASAEALPLPQTVSSEDDPALVALGARAFRRYPAQLTPYLRIALASRNAAALYGLWVDSDAGAGGLVRARMADGSGALAVTCATCHAAPLGGRIADGVPNARFDPGAAMIDAAVGGIGPGLTAAVAQWGPGRLDVTTQAGTEPVRISDLRPVRWLTYLQQDATVRVRDRTALAIRIETLLITGHGQVLRPPRVVALALAAYLTSLADALPPTGTTSSRGAQVFASSCAGCHMPPTLTGPPVALAVVGTDPTLGQSLDRGTGTYRVPSLRGVGTRGPLLHDGTVPSLDAMFDPTRITSAFTSKLHGTGAAPGHPFGLDLGDADRTALVAYLSAL
jgi:cytochrome c553